MLFFLASCDLSGFGKVDALKEFKTHYRAFIDYQFNDGRWYDWFSSYDDISIEFSGYSTFDRSVTYVEGIIKKSQGSYKGTKVEFNYNDRHVSYDYSGGSRVVTGGITSSYDAEKLIGDVIDDALEKILKEGLYSNPIPGSFNVSGIARFSFIRKVENKDYRIITKEYDVDTDREYTKTTWYTMENLRYSASYDDGDYREGISIQYHEKSNYKNSGAVNIEIRNGIVRIIDSSFTTGGTNVGF